MNIKIIIISLFLLVSSCELFDEENKVISVESVKFTTKHIEMEIGEFSTLSFSITPKNAENKNVIWNSHNDNIATVDNTGLISAINEGTTFITVTSVDGQYTDTCEIKVISPAISLTEIVLDEESCSIVIGETKQLTYSLVPENTTEKEISWSSSNSNVVTVDNTGLLTAIDIGTSIITLSNSNGVIKTTCYVDVVASSIPVIGFNIVNDSETIYINDVINIAKTFNPTNATNQKVIYTSSDPTVATVNELGEVKGISSGSTTIKGVTDDGNFSDSCIVNVQTVISPLPIVLPENISFRDKDFNSNKLSGEIKIKKALDESSITHYVIYWGRGNSRFYKVGSAIKILKKTGSDLTFSLPQSTQIPPNANKLLVYSKNNYGESLSCIATSFIDLPIISDIDINIYDLNKIEIADIDNDGDNDIICISDQKILSILENDGFAKFNNKIISSELANVEDYKILDLDKDGDLDIVVSCNSFGRSSLEWFENNGLGDFTKQIIEETTSHGYFNCIKAVDIDNDSDIDILTGGHSNIELFRNDSKQNFSIERYHEPNIRVSELDCYDIDGDNILDIIVGSWQTRTLSWYKNDGNFGLSSNLISNNLYLQSIKVVDIDNDGDIDIISAHYDLNIHKNDGSGSFSKSTINSFSGMKPFDNIVYTDFNGDFKNDILVQYNGSDKLYLFYNEQNNNWDYYEFFDINYGSISDFKVVDINSDGILDILYSRPLKWFNFATN